MKIMNLVFHPDLSASRVNRIWKKVLEESAKITTRRDLYSEYPDFNIDVEKEQQLLTAHDRIVFQFPLYWYSMPPLLKKWMDDVLTFDFAYGKHGDKLKSKDMQVIVSVGGRGKFYSGFDIFSTIPDLLRPFQLTANLTQMNYLIPEWMFEADDVETDIIKSHGEKFAAFIDDPKRSNPREYLYGEMTSELNQVYQGLGQ